MGAQGLSVLNVFFLFLLFFSKPEEVNAQLGSKRKQKKVEVLRIENNAKRALLNKEFYVNIHKPNGKKLSYHIGDPISVIDLDDQLVQGIVSSVLPDRFTVLAKVNKSEAVFPATLHVSEIKGVNRHLVYKGLKSPLTVSYLSPFFDDWNYDRLRPGEDPSTFVWVGAIGAVSMVTANRKKLFNRIDLEKTDWELRVLRY